MTETAERRIFTHDLEDFCIAGTPAEAIAHYQALADAGMQYFLAVVSRNDVETVRLLAERVIPKLRPVCSQIGSR